MSKPYNAHAAGTGAAARHTEKPSAVNTTKRNSQQSGDAFMDPATAAYVQHHELAFLLQTMDKVLRDVEADCGASASVPSSSSPPTAQVKSSSTNMHSQESAATTSSPLSENEGGSFRAVDGPPAKTLEAALMLQLLLSSFTPLAITSTAASGQTSRNGLSRQLSSSPPPSPPPLPLTKTTRDAAECNATNGSALNGGTFFPADVAGAATPVTSPTSRVPWPANAFFASKDAAVKAEVCRCFAQQCERLRSGIGLVDACGPGLRWSHLCSTQGGHERLGVAFVFDIFRCWRQVVVPLLCTTGDLSLTGGAPNTPGNAADAAAAAEALFDSLVTSPAPAQVCKNQAASDIKARARQERAEAACSYWCLTIVQGYCRDFPAELWRIILRAARCAAAAQNRQQQLKQQCTLSNAVSAENECSETGELSHPLLTSETLLLRSFLTHLVCTREMCSEAAAMGGDRIVTEALATAKLRSPTWAWAEVSALEAEMRRSTAGEMSGKAEEEEATLAALLCADSYWAVFLQPYAAMCAQYFL